MSFTVTAKVPPPFAWQELVSTMIAQGEQAGYSRDLLEDPNFRHQYAQLLQFTSWNYDINWNVSDGTFQLQVPLSTGRPARQVFEDYENTSPRLTGLSERLRQSDRTDESTGTSIDAVSAILLNIIREVPVKRVASFFQRK